ncbi:MAG: serine hydrolase domain-containing protein [Phenylobacterium sp.]|jgi:CubicO group peptidase (beta-lactamase class C family)|nr:serine hydrolase domain-containing protein [Phenylobacterium sp.]
MIHLLLLAGALAFATQAWAAPDIDRLDRAVLAAEAAGFKGQLLAGDRQAVLYDRTVGMETPDLWIWGSVSKQIAATLVMMEVERGMLSLDDTVTSRLPAFPDPDTGAATLRQLLQHTSGLPDPDAAGDGDVYRRAGPTAGGTADALGLCAGPRARPTGTFAYNNCDTIVLGAVLEAATGLSFGELFARKIAEPLGLTSARMARPGETFPISRSGGASGAGSAGPETPIYVAAYGPGGALVGPARDLMAIDQALLTGALVSPESAQTLWRGEPSLGYVALGAWGFTAPLAGCAQPVRLVERRGAVDGVQTRNLLAPDLGRALILFTPDADLEFGEIWQGEGLTHDLAAAAFC